MTTPSGNGSVDPEHSKKADEAKLDQEKRASTETPTDDASNSTGESSSSGCCHRIRARARNSWQKTKRGVAEIKEPIMEAKVMGKQWARKACTLESVKQRLPITKWILKYRCKHFQGDLIAGLTVGLTVIPQGLAYAQVAGLSPEFGLYSAFMGCFVYMILGTAKDITFGPTAIMSLLTGEFAVSPIPKDATYAIILSLFAGIIQLAMGILHIGFVVDYISHPVINSFTTAAAITIAWGQIKSWFGFKKVPSDFLSQVYWNFKKLPETRLYDFLMGLVCILALYGMKKSRSIKWGNPKKMGRFKRGIKYIIWLATTARNAIVVVLASVVAAVLMQHGMQPFTMTGNITAGLPPFRAPRFSLTVGNETIGITEILGDIGPGLAIIPLLGLVETIAIGKAFARKAGYSIDSNQELLAIGVANIVGCFVGAYPVTGSFSRTAVNAQSGVMTPAGGIWTALLVLLALAFLTPLFYYIPNASLAAVIIMAVMDMVDFGLVLKLWRVKKIDIIPWFITFIFSLTLGIEYGILIGVGVSLLLLLYPWARPKFQVNIIQTTGNENPDMVVMTLNQGLVFPGIEHFKDKIYSKALTGENSKSVVLDFSYIANTDFTAVEGLHQLLEEFEKRKKRLVVCNLRPEILDIFTRAKLKHFQHFHSVDDAISLLKEENEEKLTRVDSVAMIEGGGVLPLDTPDIERCTIYNDASDDDDNDDDPTDDEALDKNYIVTPF